MAHRPHPRGTTTNPADGPWSTCDFCGFVYSQNRLQFDFQFAGGPTPINTGFLVCDRCSDDINYQQSLLILPPDPPVIFNTRPENYTVDETNWLATEDGDILTTESDVPLGTNIPNPNQDANLTNLVTEIDAPGGSVAVMYLDLFDGDPSDGGVSVLEAITGSATRTNIAVNLTTTTSASTNAEPIIIALASEQTTNVSHVGFYSAATAGSLIMSGTVSATYPLIVQGAAVQFDALGITIDLT